MAERKLLFLKVITCPFPMPQRPLARGTLNDLIQACRPETVQSFFRQNLLHNSLNRKRPKEFRSGQIAIPGVPACPIAKSPSCFARNALWQDRLHKPCGETMAFEEESRSQRVSGASENRLSSGKAQKQKPRAVDIVPKHESGLALLSWLFPL